MQEKVNLPAKINGIQILIVDNKRIVKEEHPYKSNDSLNPKVVAQALSLGRGVSKLVLDKFRAMNEEESGRLHKDLSYNKAIDYEDPNTGPMKGVAISIDIINSDEHFGVRFYNATILIHEKLAEPPINPKMELELTLDELLELRAEKIKDFQSRVKDYEFLEKGAEIPGWLGSEKDASSWFNLNKITSTITDGIDFIVENVYKGIGYFLHARYALYGLVSEVDEGVTKLSQLYNDVKFLLQEPAYLLSFTTGIVKDIFELQSNILLLRMFNPYKNFPKYYGHQLKGIAAIFSSYPGWLGGRGNPSDYNEPFTIPSPEYLPTSRQLQFMANILPGFELLNLMVLEAMIRYSLTPGSFLFREDMIRAYNSIIIRIRASGLSQDTQVKLETKVTNYFNSLPHKNIKIVNVFPPTSLLKVVQDYYGNVDHFYDVARLNNIKNTELVSGDIEMI